MARVVAPALEALLRGIIDYAGSFPTASLSCQCAYGNFQIYKQSPHSWMLSRFVTSSQDLDLLPPASQGPFSVVANSDHPLADAIESRSLVQTSKPFYWECAVDDLETAANAHAFAKIRMGGVVPEAIPTVEQLARFILRCADLRVPFKATAGLHHPIRASHPLTYEVGAPTAVMHGFINLFMAAAFVWAGQRDIHLLLSETDPSAFRFDEQARWRDWSLPSGRIREARRNFAHSFGSCSFIEPVQSLQELGWL